MSARAFAPLDRLLAVAGRETRFRFSNWNWLFWDLFYPTLYLLALGTGLSNLLTREIPGGSYAAFLLPGILAMAGQTLAVNSSYALFVDRDNGIFFEHLTYPVKRADFLGGRLLFNLALEALQLLILLVSAKLLLAVPLSLPRAAALFAAAILAVPLWFFALFAAAIRIRRVDAYATFLNVVYFGALFASPLFYPLEQMPRWFQALSLANPLTWAVDLLRALAFGDPRTARLLFEGAAYLLGTGMAFAGALKSLRTALR